MRPRMGIWKIYVWPWYRITKGVPWALSKSERKAWLSVESHFPERRAWGCFLTLPASRDDGAQVTFTVGPSTSAAHLGLLPWRPTALLCLRTLVPHSVLGCLRQDEEEEGRGKERWEETMFTEHWEASGCPECFLPAISCSSWAPSGPTPSYPPLPTPYHPFHSWGLELKLLLPTQEPLGIHCDTEYYYL